MSGSKKQLLQGNGVFCTSHRDLSSDVAARLFFSTSSRSATPDGAAASRVHVSRAGHEGRAYQSLTVPAGFKLRKAPMLDRDSCVYSQSFVTMPLTGAKIDREVAALAMSSDREGSQKAAAGNKVPTYFMTSNQQFFQAPTKDGRGKFCGPSKEAAVHVDLNSKSLETKSLSRRTYSQPDALMARSLRGEALSCQDSEATQSVVAFIHRSEHETHFCPPSKGFRRMSEYPKTGNPAYGSDARN